MPPDVHSNLESVATIQQLITKPRRYSNGPKYHCQIGSCGASFQRLDQLDRHEYHHTGIKKHACVYDDCGKTYSILTHLKRHLRTTHERTAPPEKNVRCAIEDCNKMFQTACSMQRHLREVHENPKIYHCAHCGEKFTQKLKMRRHEIMKHAGAFPFSCQKCTKGFYQQQQCTRHEINCKIYSCPSCDLQFDKWSIYVKHCKETQHGRKYYKCEHCERVYTKPGELKSHVAAKHLSDGEQNSFACKEPGCVRSYAYERNLRQHIQTAHSGKRFECKAAGCASIFSSGQNLTKHMQRKHTLEVQEGPQKISKVPLVHQKVRRKRKDAGQSIMSNLTKLAGLTVDKNFDRLLKQRDEIALLSVANTLSIADAAESNAREHDLESLLELALNGDN